MLYYLLVQELLLLQMNYGLNNADVASGTVQRASIASIVDLGNETLAQVLVNGNTTGGTDIAVSAGDDITFTDTSKALFGAGSDLEIYHNGTNDFIVSKGSYNVF